MSKEELYQSIKEAIERPIAKRIREQIDRDGEKKRRQKKGGSS